jgi:hypothetical protein
MSDPRLACPECGSPEIRAIPVEEIRYSVQFNATYGVEPDEPLADGRETWRYYCAMCAHEPEDPWDFVLPPWNGNTR